MATELFAHGGNILEAHQFDDTETGRFFMRVIFDLIDEGKIGKFKSVFGITGDYYGMDWTIRPRDEPQKVLLLASKFDHCLVDS